MTDITAMTAAEIEDYVRQARTEALEWTRVDLDETLATLALRLASVLRENERLRGGIADIAMMAPRTDYAADEILHAEFERDKLAEALRVARQGTGRRYAAEGYVPMSEEGFEKRLRAWERSRHPSAPDWIVNEARAWRARALAAERRMAVCPHGCSVCVRCRDEVPTHISRS